MEPDEPIQMNIYQNTCFRKHWNWPHFDDKQGLKEERNFIEQIKANFLMIFAQEQIHPFLDQ